MNVLTILFGPYYHRCSAVVISMFILDEYLGRSYRPILYVAECSKHAEEIKLRR